MKTFNNLVIDIKTSAVFHLFLLTLSFVVFFVVCAWVDSLIGNIIG